MKKIPTHLTERKWFYPFIYLLFLIISFLPLYTEKAYAYENTQDVIINLLMVVLIPYKAWGVVFHITTLIIVLYIALRPEKSGRLFSAYMGLNFLVIALVQSSGTTEKYGFVMQTSSLVMSIILGFIWKWVVVLPSAFLLTVIKLDRAVAKALGLFGVRHSALDVDDFGNIAGIVPD